MLFNASRNRLQPLLQTGRRRVGVLTRYKTGQPGKDVDVQVRATENTVGTRSSTPSRARESHSARGALDPALLRHDVGRESPLRRGAAECFSLQEQSILAGSGEFSTSISARLEFCDCSRFYEERGTSVTELEARRPRQDFLDISIYVYSLVFSFYRVTCLAALRTSGIASLQPLFAFLPHDKDREI